MAKYRVITKSFINNSLVDEGTVVDFDGVPSDNLEPLDSDAISAAQQSNDANVEAIARQKAAAVGGDPNSVDTSAAISAAADAAAQVIASTAGAAGLV